MRKLAKFFEDLARDVIDIARYFYGYFIDSTGNAGRALVNTLIGVTIMVLVGLDFIFIDNWDLLSESKDFGGMILVSLIVHIVLILKLIAMMQAVQSRSKNRDKK